MLPNTWYSVFFWQMAPVVASGKRKESWNVLVRADSWFQKSSVCITSCSPKVSSGQEEQPLHLRALTCLYSLLVSKVLWALMCRSLCLRGPTEMSTFGQWHGAGGTAYTYTQSPMGTRTKISNHLSWQQCKSTKLKLCHWTGIWVSRHTRKFI